MKCVQYRIHKDRVELPSTYKNPSSLPLLYLSLNSNICQIYQRDYKGQKVKLSGSGIIVRSFPQSSTKINL